MFRKVEQQAKSLKAELERLRESKHRPEIQEQIEASSLEAELITVRLTACRMATESSSESEE